jgi:amidohydrolase
MVQTVMIDSLELKRQIARVYPSAIKIRRVLHRHPELSGQERKTALRVASELRRLGLVPRFYLDGTAVVAVMANGPGKTVVLRADLDALPILENSGLSFASRAPGIMHACGHDMHTAILLGAASVLDRLRASWKGKVVFLFQPSEEVAPGGAAPLIRSGAFPTDAAAVFGLHVNPDHPTGTIGLREGGDFAGMMTFRVVIHGRGGHSAAPKSVVNPILCASRMMVALMQLSDRHALVMVGTVHAGVRTNIIPDQAEFSGTVRTHSASIQRATKLRLAQLLTAIAKSSGATVKIEFEASYPPSLNDPALTRRMRTVMTEALGAAQVVARPKPVMYSEDFAYYQQKAPGLFIHLGVRPRRKRTMPGLHSPRFAPEETAMETGMFCHALFVLELLS